MRRCLVAERIGSGVAELRVQIRQVDFQRAVGMPLMAAYGISEGFLQVGTVGLCLRQLVEAVLRGVQSVGVLSGFRIEMQAPEFSLDVAVHGLVEGVGELVPSASIPGR